MKCSSQDKIIVRAELLEPGGEVTLVYQATSFVYDNKTIDRPVRMCELRALDTEIEAIGPTGSSGQRYLSA